MITLDSALLGFSLAIAFGLFAGYLIGAGVEDMRQRRKA